MIAYLSHSLGTGNGDATVRRHDNIANATLWLEFLYDATPWNVTVPWFANVVALRELWRPRAFAGQLEMLQRSDAIVLTGGVISDHMHEEIEHARSFRIAVIDLTDLGVYPPLVSDAIRAALLERADRAVAVARLVL